MCITPITVGFELGDFDPLDLSSYGAEPIQAACRNCWQCRANRVNDLVGRCIAEQQDSDQTLAVTLTYRDSGQDALHAKSLVYKDFQLFMKRLRRAGYQVRYIVAGEYGSNKGRAHWHCVLFLKGKQIEVEKMETRVDWSFWPHGFSFFQEAAYEGFHYLLKYALKNSELTVNIGHLAMSKKPPLGHEYFQDRAAQYVEQHLAPQDYHYSFPDVFDAKKKRRKFMIQGVTRENFLMAFENGWRDYHGTEPPRSKALEDWNDMLEAQRLLDEYDFDSEIIDRSLSNPLYFDDLQGHARIEQYYTEGYFDDYLFKGIETVLFQDEQQIDICGSTVKFPKSTEQYLTIIREGKITWLKKDEILHHAKTKMLVVQKSVPWSKHKADLILAWSKSCGVDPIGLPHEL